MAKITNNAEENISPQPELTKEIFEPAKEVKERKKETPLTTQKTKEINLKSIFKEINNYFDQMQKIKRPEIIFLTKNLYLMVKVGVSISESLNSLGSQIKNKHFQSVVISIANSVERGESFFNSINKFPKIFSQYYTSMVKVGELSGNLDITLNNIADQEKKDYELIKKVRGEAIYPLFIFGAMMLLGIGFFIFILPTYVSMFNDFGTELPIATKILIALANFFTKYGAFVLLFIILLVIGIKFLKKIYGFKIALAKFLIYFPIIGPIIIKINILRFCQTLVSLMKTDIKIEESFKIISKTISNPWFGQILENSSKEIEKGESIAKTLAKYPKLFPPMLTQIISVAESTGSMDEALTETGYFYESEIDNIMKNISSIIEPLLILLLGIGVALLAVAVIMPMYALSSSMTI